ncbi:hypothetical protein ASD79_21860 [Caulobacter sp. Root655]|uniref:hypothetical protein n=1 Tax=Caulobacter sp. Root655 TaxID=1736578 RepID=UPI0006FE1DF3|nr:hypothetical protein [Caulobacter sp. Root655]KRA63936.1 hypothetical protein ASD79_21860 [Caulobacter sp. Root655]
MLPPPAREKTSVNRIVLAVVFAFGFPALGLSQVMIWTDEATSYATRAATAASGAVAALPFGAVLGWPYVLSACCVWACLHQFGRHHRALAGLIGAITGFAVAFKLLGWHATDTLVVFPLSAVLGLATGLGVWTIAYGRQGRLPAPRAAVPSRAGSC